MPDRCSSCKADIQFATNHKTGKIGPISLASGQRASDLSVKDRTGRIVLFRVAGESGWFAHYVTKVEAQEIDQPSLGTEIPTETQIIIGESARVAINETLYLNHFADCPTRHRH